MTKKETLLLQSRKNSKGLPQPVYRTEDCPPAEQPESINIKFSCYGLSIYNILVGQSWCLGLTCTWKRPAIGQLHRQCLFLISEVFLTHLVEYELRAGRRTLPIAVHSEAYMHILCLIVHGKEAEYYRIIPCLWHKFGIHMFGLCDRKHSLKGVGHVKYSGSASPVAVHLCLKEWAPFWRRIGKHRNNTTGKPWSHITSKASRVIMILSVFWGRCQAIRRPILLANCCRIADEQKSGMLTSKTVSVIPAHPSYNLDLCMILLQSQVSESGNKHTMRMQKVDWWNHWNFCVNGTILMAPNTTTLCTQKLSQLDFACHRETAIQYPSCRVLVSSWQQ